MAKVEKGFLAKLRSMMLHMKDVRTEDGKNLQVDGDELEVGKEVLIESDGEWTPAPDGEYDTGEVILRVEAGKIAEIRAKNAEPENMSAKFQRIVAAFAESYEERTKKIAAAIVALGFDTYGYLVSCGDDFAVTSGKRWDDPVGDILRWMEVKHLVPETRMRSARVPEAKKTIDPEKARRQMAQDIVHKIFRRGFYTQGKTDIGPHGKHPLEDAVTATAIKERLKGILVDAFGKEIVGGALLRPIPRTDNKTHTRL